ncbi:S1 RNA-binding domain-containing protein [Streptococcus moroccensis]|uniref:General stress protein 13 n=1 Tax=Streptococcus moroccensis TaxID=1451356 RepID=A0ABT9YTJ5_9STRE|nr:S1 RNA-binding domain-containing protein [Streptococcus moroccensis]MDQ0223317.1 general stress protein 13 [Streptococcus moroccensis]
MKTGDKLTGIVTGVQPYGVFVSLGDGAVGLVHISELKTGFVENIYKVLEIGQEVQVQVIDVDEYSGKASFSIRSLEEEKQKPPRKHRFSSNKRKYGFEPLAQAMPKWIDEGFDYLTQKETP